MSSEPFSFMTATYLVGRILHTAQTLEEHDRLQMLQALKTFLEEDENSIPLPSEQVKTDLARLREIIDVAIFTHDALGERHSSTEH